MNKRIKALAVQAGMVYDSPDQGQFDDFDEQKFAELIVKECAGIYCAIENGNMQEGTYYFLVALQKRFGIE